MRKNVKVCLVVLFSNRTASLHQGSMWIKYDVSINCLQKRSSKMGLEIIITLAKRYTGRCAFTWLHITTISSYNTTSPHYSKPSTSHEQWSMSQNDLIQLLHDSCSSLRPGHLLLPPHFLWIIYPINKTWPLNQPASMLDNDLERENGDMLST